MCVLCILTKIHSNPFSSERESEYERDSMKHNKDVEYECMGGKKKVLYKVSKYKLKMS